MAASVPHRCRCVLGRYRIGEAPMLLFAGPGQAASTVTDWGAVGTGGGGWTP